MRFWVLGPDQMQVRHNHVSDDKVGNMRVRQAKNGFLRMIGSAALGAALVLTAPSVLLAQGLFSPVAKVNDQVVTGYELEQRIRLYEVLNTPGDLREEAMTKLVDERLQLKAARDAGVAPDAKEIAAGVSEFAARGDMDSQTFLSSLAAEGVAPETFTAFIEAGIAWRNLVRQRFGALATINEDEIDQELGLSGQSGTLEVLFSEIFLPTNTPRNAAITQELAPQIATITTTDAFEDAARRFSAGPSRENGGRVENWLQLRDLPPPLRAQIIEMRVGEISPPIELPNAIGFFQLRGKREARIAPKAGGRVDYVTMSLPLERARAIQSRIDTCNDLYGVAKGAEKDAIARTTQANTALPSDLRLELARLDPGETTLRELSGGAQLIMLCGRLPAPDGTSGGDEDTETLREQVRQDLRNRKLTAFADGLLQQLRGDAVIVVK